MIGTLHTCRPILVTAMMLVPACARPPVEPVGLGPRAASIQVEAIRPEGNRWVAEVAERPLAESTTKRRRHALREGDLLADGIVTHVSPLGLFAGVSLDQTFQGTKKRLVLRFLPPQPPPPISVSHETTRITSPLLPDGTPDYGAWLNAEHGAGVTEENNAAPLVQAALGQLVDTGHTFWDGLSFRGGSEKEAARGVMWQPWVDQDCPRCVARLERNSAPLARIARAVERRRFFVPQPTGARLPLAVPTLLPYRLAVNAFAGRGMLRLGRGDPAGAGQDAVTIERLASLLGQGYTLVPHLVANALRDIGIPLVTRFSAAPSASVEQARGLLTQLVELPSTLGTSDIVDEGERFVTLDSVLSQRQAIAEAGGAWALDMWGWTLPDFDAERGELATSQLTEVVVLSNSSVDWDEVLRLTNRDIDRNVAVLRAASAPARARAREARDAGEREWRRAAQGVIAELKRRVRGDATRAVDLAMALDALAASPEGRRRLAVLRAPPRSSLHKSALMWNETETQYRMAVFSVAVAVHRLESGAFPKGLEALASPLLPARFAAVTPLPGYTLRYVRTPRGAANGLADRYALTAAPEQVGQTGNRGFCADSTGAMRSTTDGTAPKVIEGVCDPALPLVH